MTLFCKHESTLQDCHSSLTSHTILGLACQSLVDCGCWTARHLSMSASHVACLQDSSTPPHHENWTMGVGNFKLTRAQLAGIGLRLLKNHVLWGCLIGLILSLSKIGPRWLNPGVLHFGS